MLTRKSKQSYQHTHPCRQHLTTIVSLTFDLRVNACRVTAMHCMYTKLGVDSSSHFPFRLRTHTKTNTHRDTDATDQPTHASATAGMGNYLIASVWNGEGVCNTSKNSRTHSIIWMCKMHSGKAMTVKLCSRS